MMGSSNEDKSQTGMDKLIGKYSQYKGCFGDRKMILFIVFVALLLDNMLLTTVVPIVPDFLIKHHAKRNLTELIANSLQPNESDCLKFLHIKALKKRLLKDNHLPWASRGNLAHSAPKSSSNISIENIEEVFDNYRHLLTKLDHFYNRSIFKKLNECESIFKRSLKKFKEKESGNDNIQVGMMFASKAVVQLLVNPLIGPLTNKIGYSIPMFTGFVIMFCSTIVFAFGETYTILFIARALQGVGSACSSVSGMGMLATCYTDDKERSRAFSWALSGLAVGVLIGPPFGGITYQFINKQAPFLILASLALLDGILQLIALKPAIRPEEEEGTSLLKLLKDPYILIAAGSITFGNMGIAMLEPTLPLWMWKNMHSQGWEQGVVFLPCSISYLIGTNTFGTIALKVGRGITAGLGMLIIGICLLVIPLCTKLPHLIAPMFGLGFAIGMVDSSMMPLMGYLVDLRHVAVYGSVYAIADVAFCMGYAVGPILGGAIIKGIGFSWMLWIISVVCIAYAPLTLFLRNPPKNEEAKYLITAENERQKEKQTPQIPTIQLGSTLGFDPTRNGEQEYLY